MSKSAERGAKRPVSYTHLDVYKRQGLKTHQNPSQNAKTALTNAVRSLSSHRQSRNTR